MGAGQEVVAASDMIDVLVMYRNFQPRRKKRGCEQARRAPFIMHFRRAGGREKNKHFTPVTTRS